MAPEVVIRPFQFMDSDYGPADETMSADLPVKVSMRIFLRTGEFGPVKLGDDSETIANAFGHPQIVGGASRSQTAPVIWKYGDVEFHLSAGQLRLIFCDSFNRLHLGEAAPIEWWFFEGFPSCETVKRELAKAQLSFVRLETPHEPTVDRLRLESGVELLFSTGADATVAAGVPRMFGFSYSE